MYTKFNILSIYMHSQLQCIQTFKTPFLYDIIDMWSLTISSMMIESPPFFFPNHIKYTQMQPFP